MSLNPTALLKIVGALTPLMSDKAAGEAMVNEIRAIFNSMDICARAMVEIQNRLTSIDQKLAAGMALPLTETEIRDLVSNGHLNRVQDAIDLGMQHAGK